MLEIHITVSCPDLLAAAQLLKGVASNDPVSAKNPTADPAPMPANPAQTPGPAPVTTAQTVGQTAAPTNTVVPLAGAPTFTMEQICRAGADLITQNPGVMPQVNGLLAQYGVQTITDLKPEYFGAVATALRGLGAKI